MTTKKTEYTMPPRERARLIRNRSESARVPWKRGPMPKTVERARAVVAAWEQKQAEIEKARKLWVRQQQRKIEDNLQRGELSQAHDALLRLEAQIDKWEREVGE